MKLGPTIRNRDQNLVITLLVKSQVFFGDIVMIRPLTYSYCCKLAVRCVIYAGSVQGPRLPPALRSARLDSQAVTEVLPSEAQGSSFSEPGT